MKQYLIFNFKNNPQNLAQAKELFKIYCSFDNSLFKKFHSVLMPPDIFLLATKDNVSDKFLLGAQDVFWFNKIQATGEITPKMLTTIGVDYALIGHSERIHYLREDTSIINLKLKACLSNRLTSILCVGETEKSRTEEILDFKTKQEIFDQLNYSLRGVKLTKLMNLIIAYEPKWAIGKGKAQDMKSIEAVVSIIHFWLNRRFPDEDGQNIPVLYGGSVNSSNINDILLSKDIDGVLIGNASINKQELRKLVKKLTPTPNRL